MVGQALHLPPWESNLNPLRNDSVFSQRENRAYLSICMLPLCTYWICISTVLRQMFRPMAMTLGMTCDAMPLQRRTYNNTSQSFGTDSRTTFHTLCTSWVAHTWFRPGGPHNPRGSTGNFYVAVLFNCGTAECAERVQFLIY